MAGPRTCRNPPFAGKRELAGQAAIKGSGNPSPPLASSCVPTPAPAQAEEAPVPAPGRPGKYTDKDLQRNTKLALELFVKAQEYGQLQASTKLTPQGLVPRLVLWQFTPRLLTFLSTVRGPLRNR